MHLPELCNVWVVNLSCFVVVCWVADFFLEHFTAMAVAQVFHERLADFDVLVDALVRVDGAAGSPGEQHRLDKWSVGDRRVCGTLGGKEPSEFLALHHAFDQFLHDIKMGTTSEDGVFGLSGPT